MKIHSATSASLAVALLLSDSLFAQSAAQGHLAPYAASGNIPGVNCVTFPEPSSTELTCLYKNVPGPDSRQLARA